MQRVFRNALGQLMIEGPTRYGIARESVEIRRDFGNPLPGEQERVVRAVARQVPNPFDAACRASRILARIGESRRRIFYARARQAAWELEYA